MRVLGVCAGNGVMLHPFQRKHEIVGNIEPRQVFHSPGNVQWKLNFDDIPIDKSEIMLGVNSVDIIIGHPDCGSGSVLRLSRAKKNVEYANNESLNTYFKAVNKCEPVFFILENLPAFGKEFPKEKLAEILPNYRFRYLQGSVAHWGNSQMSRKRLVIVGIRKDTDREIDVLFKLPKLNKENLHFADYFELGLYEDNTICHIREPYDKTCNLILGNRKIITYNEACNEWQKRVGESRWHVGGKMNNQPGVTRNLPGKYPTTMRKQNRQFSTKGLVLSPREMANIQGVPLEFKLYWSQHESKRIYDINKARTTVTKCPPYEIGAWFERKINKTIKEYGLN